MIFCGSQKDVDILKNALKRKMGNKYHLEEPAKFNPRLLVKNATLDEELKDNDKIVSDILRRNKLEGADDKSLKVVTLLKFKNSKNAHVVLEVSPQIRKNLIRRGFLYLGWKRCALEEHLNIMQYNKCCLFGHLEKNCRSDKTACLKCAGNHTVKNCSRDILKCINCTSYNSKFNTKLNSDHSASDRACFLYEDHIYKLKRRINYG
nr:unnamed protein product [Callosobruchus analis]